MMDLISVIFGLVIIVGGIFLYFLPTIIAMGGNLKNTASILIINLFLGWSGIFWVIALAWSVSGTAEKKSAQDMLL